MRENNPLGPFPHQRWGTFIMGPLPNFPDPVTRPMSLGNSTSWNSAMKETTYSRQQTIIDTMIERGDPPVRVNLRVTQAPSGGGPRGRRGAPGDRREAPGGRPEAAGGPRSRQETAQSPRGGAAGRQKEAAEGRQEVARRPSSDARGGRQAAQGTARDHPEP